MKLKRVQIHSCFLDSKHFRTDLEGARLFGIRFVRSWSKGSVTVSLIAFIFWIFGQSVRVGQDKDGERRKTEASLRGEVLTGSSRCSLCAFLLPCGKPPAALGRAAGRLGLTPESPGAARLEVAGTEIPRQKYPVHPWNGVFCWRGTCSQPLLPTPRGGHHTSSLPQPDRRHWPLLPLALLSLLGR